MIGVSRIKNYIVPNELNSKVDKSEDVDKFTYIMKESHGELTSSIGGGIATFEVFKLFRRDYRLKILDIVPAPSIPPTKEFIDCIPLIISSIEAIELNNFYSSNKVEFLLNERGGESLLDERLNSAFPGVIFDNSYLSKLANSEDAHRYYDNFRGHICIINQINDRPYRITVERYGRIIFSHGPLKQQGLLNYIKTGRYYLLNQTSEEAK